MDVSKLRVFILKTMNVKREEGRVLEYTSLHHLPEYLRRSHGPMLVLVCMHGFVFE